MIRFTTLPNTIYTVKVPLLATLDEYDMLSGELPYKEGTDGNRIQQHHDMTIVGMSIDRMLEVYSNGFPIRIMNKSDLFEIYNTLKRYYLDADKDNLLSINQRAHDDERIPDIKKFLQEILSNNEHLLTAEEKRNSLKAIMERTLVGNIITLDKEETEKIYGSLLDCGNIIFLLDTESKDSKNKFHIFAEGLREKIYSEEKAKRLFFQKKALYVVVDNKSYSRYDATSGILELIKRFGIKCIDTFSVNKGNVDYMLDVLEVAVPALNKCM